MEIKRALIIPDIHVGVSCDGIESHDQRAIDLVLDVARDIKPDYLYILGDFLDAYSVSSHAKDPRIKSILKDEIYLANKLLDKFDQTCNWEQKHFLAGNHSHRVQRYIADKAADLFDLVRVEDLLKLSERGYVYHEYSPKQLVRVGNSSLFARHEPYSRSPEATARKAMCSLIYGHTHQLGEFQIVSANGDNYRAISCGWLGNYESPVFDYVKSRPNWAQGFSVCTILEDGVWFNNLVHIIDYKCVVDGYLYVN